MPTSENKRPGWSVVAVGGVVRVTLRRPAPLLQMPGDAGLAIIDLAPDDAVAFGERLQDEASIAKDSS